jgi:hypothetical protein
MPNMPVPKTHSHSILTPRRTNEVESFCALMGVTDPGSVVRVVGLVEPHALKINATAETRIKRFTRPPVPIKNPVSVL